MKPTAEEILAKYKLVPEDMANYHIWGYVCDAMEAYAAAVKSEPAEGAEEDITLIRKIFDRNGFDFDAFEYENEYSAKNLIAAIQEYAAQRQSQPTAEGAEEILKAEDYICEWCNKIYGGGKELEDWTSDEVMRFANDFAALTADKIAEEMVEDMYPKEFVQWVLQNVEHKPYSDDNYIIGSGFEYMTLDNVYEYWKENER